MRGAFYSASYLATTKPMALNGAIARAEMSWWSAYPSSDLFLFDPTWCEQLKRVWPVLFRQISEAGVVHIQCIRHLSSGALWRKIREDMPRSSLALHRMTIFPQGFQMFSVVTVHSWFPCLYTSLWYVSIYIHIYIYTVMYIYIYIHVSVYVYT